MRVPPFRFTQNTRILLFESLQRSTEQVSYPVSGSKCGASDSGRSGVSKHLLAEFNVANFPRFILVGTHLIAYPTEKNRCAQREAQALVLKNLIQKEKKRNSSLEVVLLGDFNDFDADYIDAENKFAPCL